MRKSIKKLVDVSGLKQREFASRLGISPQRLSGWYLGKYPCEQIWYSEIVRVAEDADIDKHVCQMNLAHDGVCFICGSGEFKKEKA